MENQQVVKPTQKEINDHLKSLKTNTEIFELEARNYKAQLDILFFKNKLTEMMSANVSATPEVEAVSEDAVVSENVE